MPIPTTLADLSTTPGDNFPDGGELPTTVDDYLRAHAALIAQLRDTLVPPGTVITVAMGSPPDGYLKANGDLVSRTTYASLFAAIGTTFGAGDGSTTFKLPDLRGEFVRGYDDGRGVDSGRVFGNGQTDEFKTHSHNTDNITVFSGNTPATSVVGAFQTIATNGGSEATSFSGGTETRPRNVALLYVIKH